MFSRSCFLFTMNTCLLPYRVWDSISRIALATASTATRCFRYRSASDIAKRDATSRTFLPSMNFISRILNRIHSLVKRLEELGHITPEEASTYPHRNVLYRALGQGEVLEPDIFTVPFPSAGSLMMCSDGLWGVVSEQDLVRVVREAPNLQRACQSLVSAANAAGGPDNISVVLVQMTS